MTCPHCWPESAQTLAAENATIAALQVENARLVRDLAAMERTAHAIADERTHIAVEWHNEWARAEALAHALATAQARIVSQDALIDSQRRIRTVLLGALRRQAARVRELEKQEKTGGDT